MVDAGDRREVAHEVIIELVEQCRVDRGGCCCHEQRIAVSGRTRGRLGADIVAGANPVFNHERLAEPLQQPLADQARREVDRPAGRDGDDDAHGPRRKSLRAGDARSKGQGGSAGCEMQEFATGIFHHDDTSLFQLNENSRASEFMKFRAV